MNKYIFAAFDILYYKGENVQINSKLEDRYEKLNDVIDKCFGFNYNMKKYSDNFDMKKISKYYSENLSNYLKYLMSNLGKSKDGYICMF